MREAPAVPGTPASDGTKYDSSAVLGAVLLTIFLPFVALIVALVSRSSQTDGTKRRQLEQWAIASGCVLILAPVVALVLVASIQPHRDTTGPCVGGPAIGVAGTPLGDGRFRIPCEISGSTVMRFPDGTPGP
jgi:hypothetical protein